MSSNESESGPHFEKHLFICTYSRQEGASCRAKGSGNMRDDLKAWAKDQLGDTVRVNASGCLGQCEHGIAAVIYPKGKWCLNLTADEAGQSKLKSLLMES